MDYIGHKCPVCGQYFHIGDDIVVCPECGTPSHRECYIQNGKCINYNKHADGYDYSKESCTNQQPQDDFILCKKCGTPNEEDNFFCEKCGAPLQEAKGTNNSPFSANQTNTQQYPGATQNVMFFDPLGGVKSDADFGDSVTAGECAKLTKQSTQYFSIVFNNIARFSKSRYNFCALLFSGGYLLYRKMYKIGAFFTALEALMFVAQLYIGSYISSTTAFAKLFQSYNTGDFTALMHHYYELSPYNMTMITVYSALSILTLVISVIIGATANRMYFMHCKKQIIKIKANSTESTDIDKEYIKKGGVNVGLAVSLLASKIILSYVPYMFY